MWGLRVQVSVEARWRFEAEPGGRFEAFGEIQEVELTAVVPDQLDPDREATGPPGGD